MMWLKKVVTPVKTGVQIFFRWSKNLDSGLRRNDEKGVFSCSCGFMRIILHSFSMKFPATS